MSHKSRLIKIKEAPLSWKEKDLLTAAEKYMTGALDFPLVEYAADCFPKIEDNISQKITQIWACTSAAFHLTQTSKKSNSDVNKTLQVKAARIYELEAQRILGSVFSIENKFWEAFYTRQQLDATKPLVVIDALHFSTSCQEQIAYQLLIQSLKAILAGHYSTAVAKKNHFANAKRLLMDLPTLPIQSWLNHQLI